MAFPVKEFPKQDIQNRSASCDLAFGYAREMTDVLEKMDIAVKDVAANDLVTGNVIKKTLDRVNRQVEELKAGIRMRKDTNRDNALPDNSDEILSDLEATRKRLADLSSEGSDLYETARNMRRDIRMARGAWKTLINREAGIREDRLEADDILTSEVLDKASELSVSLKNASHVDDILDRANSLRENFSGTRMPDVSFILKDIQRQSGAAIGNTTEQKRSGDTAQTDAKKREIGKRPSRPRVDTGQESGGKRYEAPPKHVKFGPPLSAGEMERASQEFFKLLWREGLPQEKVAQIMFSKTSLSEGLTIHDALSYRKGIDMLHKSIDELKIKFIR
ncbi:hypothetical protein [Pseudosulfitobacter pseudonitzschiae]|uniref:hypothetical protein n=1 Tax=Pseudosulfitobacter pseudonitzschiae TaxID=1402135 RepID=UPI003B7C0C02